MAAVAPPIAAPFKNREALSMCECISEIVRQIDEASQVPEDWDESDKDVLQSRIREVLHQFFKFGFEYQKEVCWLVTGGSRSQLAQRLISFAQLWMTFVRTRCERGRGLRPRWANHGLDFIMTVCEPHFTSCISDEEFEGPPPIEIHNEEFRALISSHVPSKEGEASSEPASPVKAGRGWHILMLRLAISSEDRERTPPTPYSHLPQ
ncbi:male germ-line sex determination [Homalodisca vitripennis]|nr:male germ-line sex determination [Homalodisca vitripennis]